MTERFFISTPTSTGRTTEPSKSNPVWSIYLDASGHEMKTGGKPVKPAKNTSAGYAIVLAG